MTDQAGTTLPRVKDSLIRLIQAKREDVARYDSPSDAKDAMGEDGSGYSVFWSDDPAQATVVINVIQNPLRFDEEVTATLVLQALGTSTDDTQFTVDTAVSLLLGDAIGILAADPSAGVAWDNDARNITVIPSGWTQPTGIDGLNMRCARIELDVRITACIYLEAPT